MILFDSLIGDIVLYVDVSHGVACFIPFTKINVNTHGSLFLKYTSRMSMIRKYYKFIFNGCSFCVFLNIFHSSIFNT